MKIRNNSIVYVKDKMFNKYLNKTLTEITEQDLEGATSLTANLFSGQPKLKKASLPDTITSIGEGCFKNCSALNRIKLSKGLKGVIPSLTFYGCKSLVEIDIPEGVTEIGDTSTNNWGQGAFGDCDNLVNIHLPSTVRYIVVGSFLSYYTTRNVFIKDIEAFSTATYGGLRGTDGYVSGGVFNKFNLYLNGNLVTDLVVTDDTNLIGKGAFAHNQKVATADLKNVSLINESAFHACPTLTSVHVGKNLAKIDSNAFVYCSNLKEIVIDKPCETLGDVPTLSNTNAIPSSAYIYVPDVTTQELYKSATNWSSVADRILVKERE